MTAGRSKGPSRGPREQSHDRVDHPDNTSGGPGRMDKSKQEEVIFEKLQKSPWKLA